MNPTKRNWFCITKYRNPICHHTQCIYCRVAHRKPHPAPITSEEGMAKLERAFSGWYVDEDDVTNTIMSPELITKIVKAMNEQALNEHLSEATNDQPQAETHSLSETPSEELAHPWLGAGLSRLPHQE